MQNQSPNHPNETATAPAPLPVLTGNPRPAQPALIDQGFCLEYFRLSHRRRFWRDILLSPLALILPFLPVRGMSNRERGLLFALMVAVTVVSACYNYNQWQKTKREDEPTV